MVGYAYSLRVGITITDNAHCANGAKSLSPGQRPGIDRPNPCGLKGRDNNRRRHPFDETITQPPPESGSDDTGVPADSARSDSKIAFKTSAFGGLTRYERAPRRYAFS